MFIAIQDDNQILEAININCIKSFSIEPSDSQDEMYFLIATESSPSEIQHYIAERNNRKDIQNILINILYATTELPTVYVDYTIKEQKKDRKNKETIFKCIT